MTGRMRKGNSRKARTKPLLSKVAYAVMSFGGFLGLGEDYYPLPWSLLTYNERLDGYEVNIADEQLRSAPKYGRHETWDWGDINRGQTLHDFYRVPPYWGI